MQTCPSCGHEQSPASRCEACGEWLGEPETPAAPQPPQPAAEPIDVPEHAAEPHPFDAPEVVDHGTAHDEPVFDVNAAGPTMPSRAIAAGAGRHRSSMNSTVTLALLGGAFALAVVIVIIIAGNAAPEDATPNDTTPTQPARSTEPPEIVKLRRAELDAVRDALADLKRDDTTAPVLDEVDRLYGDIRRYWTETDWPAVDARLTQLESKLNELKKIDAERKAIAKAKESAERTRGFVEEARGRAERAGALELAAELWKQASDADAEAARHFVADDFGEAQAKWDRALTDYEQANALASAGVAARETRSKVVERSTRRFTREQMQASGGEAWKRHTEALAEGDAAYEKTQYADAVSRFEQAGDTIEAAEQSVQRELGVKFYAVNAGYLAASILLEHASGQYLDAGGHRSLVSAYRDIGLDNAALDKIPAPDGEKLSYRLLGNALAIMMRDAIRDARGEQVQKAYNIGFQLRIIQKLLGDEDGDAVPDANKIEVAKSLVVVQREAEAAGFADPLTEEIDRIRRVLTEAGDSGPGQARQQWMSLVGRLSRYETAIKIVGEAK